jgi:hypothetical protein
MKTRARLYLPVAIGIALVPLAFAHAAHAQGWEQAPPEPPPTDPAEAPGAAPPEQPTAQPVEPTAAAPAAEAAPKIDVTTPEPPPAVERSYHVHDGFYLRLNLGYGAYGVKYESDTSTAGGAVAFDVLIGGSPSRGMAIGGALLSDYAPNVSVKKNDTNLGDANVETGLIGPFIDGFPDPKGGFHLGGMVGLANIRTDAKGGNTRNDTGGGGSAWVGYDAWVGDEWSVGGLLRFTAAVGRSEKDNQKLDSRSTALTLMFTALYH